MDNADMPAMPVSSDQGSDIDAALGSPKKYGMPTGLGLTKREKMAAMAFAVMAGGPNYIDAGWGVIAAEAVKGADELLKALDDV